MGDIILVSEKNGDWWTGSFKGSTGIFPANYVALKEETAAVFTILLYFSYFELINKFYSLFFQSPPDKPSSSPASSIITPVREIATVIAPYTAAAPNQLSLEPNQLVLIKKKSDSGWWEGELQVRDMVGS